MLKFPRSIPIILHFGNSAFQQTFHIFAMLFTFANAFYVTRPLFLRTSVKIIFHSITFIRIATNKNNHLNGLFYFSLLDRQHSYLVLHNIFHFLLYDCVKHKDSKFFMEKVFLAQDESLFLFSKSP